MPRPRIAFALLLLAATTLGPVISQHDGFHPDGAASERRVDPAAAHAEETEHFEGAGDLELASCFACLLRLQRPGDLVPPLADDTSHGPQAGGMRSPASSPLGRPAAGKLSRGPPAA